MGKTYRRKKTGGKGVDSWCKNHGICDHCNKKRTHFDRKRRKIADEDLKNYIREDEIENIGE